jgi:hypothetical protein
VKQIARQRGNEKGSELKLTLCFDFHYSPVCCFLSLIPSVVFFLFFSFLLTVRRVILRYLFFLICELPII